MKKTSFENGAIAVECKLHEKSFYDVANNRIGARFDGLGAVSRYIVINKFSVFSGVFSTYSVNGKTLDYGVEKKVVMVGRKQVTTFSTVEADFTVTQFLDDESNCIYTRTAVTAKTDLTYKNLVAIDVNYESYVSALMKTFRLGKLLRIVGGAIFGKKPKATGRVLRCDIASDFYMDIASVDGLKGLEPVWRLFTAFSMTGEVRAGETKNFDYCLSAGDRRAPSYSDAGKCLSRFAEALAEADKYISEIPYPEGLDEHGKAYYASLLNCALSNYKDLGKWKGFLAGITYQSPARTYYRDGYWTVLSVLPVKPNLVRNEIVTLAMGINKKTGKCPSAVKFNFKNYWGNHYDSPALFVCMLYDYVAHTGDQTVLDVRCPCGTVYKAAKKAIGSLAKYVDDTGLVNKAGTYNRRDWCDNVFRDGYVTYDCAVYARALYAMSKLSATKNDKMGAHYTVYFEKAKSALNDILWDENKGYFVNFKCGDFVEDNLSIDTVPVVLFGLTSDERAKRMLTAMEKMLESANNKEQCAGDFGTLSVYPFYKELEDTMSKSASPYNYHNGGDWPYWSAGLAYAKLMYGMDYKYPLYRWFDYNIEKGNYTPIEYFSPLHPDGSLLQAWSSLGAFVLSYPKGDFFRK